MEEELSTTGPMDFEEILIFTCLIALCRTISMPKTSWILNKFSTTPLEFLLPYPFFT